MKTFFCKRGISSLWYWILAWAMAGCSTGTFQGDLTMQRHYIPNQPADVFSGTFSCIERSLHHQHSSAPRTLLLSEPFKRDGEALNSRSQTWLLAAMKKAAPQHIVLSNSTQRKWYRQEINGQGIDSVFASQLKEQFQVDQIILINGEFLAFDEATNQLTKGASGESKSKGGGGDVRYGRFQSQDRLTLALTISRLAPSGVDTVETYLFANGIRHRRSKTLGFGLGKGNYGIGYTSRTVRDDALQNGLQAALPRYAAIGLLNHLYGSRIDSACLYEEGSKANAYPASQAQREYFALDQQPQEQQILHLQRYLANKRLLKTYLPGQMDDATLAAIHRFQWMVGLPPSGRGTEPLQILLLLKGKEPQWQRQAEVYRDFRLQPPVLHRQGKDWIMHLTADLTRFREPKVEFLLLGADDAVLQRQLRHLPKYSTRFQVSSRHLATYKPVHAMQIQVFDGPVLIKKKRIGL